MARPFAREAWSALGRHLTRLRKAAGYTQHSFATAVRFSRAVVGNAESGCQRVGREFWVRSDEVLRAGGRLTAGYDEVAEIERRVEWLDKPAALDALVHTPRHCPAERLHPSTAIYIARREFVRQDSGDAAW